MSKPLFIFPINLKLFFSQDLFSVLLLIVLMFITATFFISCSEGDTPSDTGQSPAETRETENNKKSSDHLTDYEQLTVKPVVIYQAVPEYPEAARKAGIQGMVVVEVVVDSTGRVAGAAVIKSIPQLDDAAVKAARQFKFMPGELHGEAVNTRLRIPFSFKLDDHE